MGLVDKARDAAKKAADAAQKGANEARDKAQELALRRKLNAQAEELGHVVVRQRDGEQGLDAEVDRLVSEVRATRAEIEALEEE
jgi:glycine/D-amino acid oxidase-like deaminating enzyme